jgi:chromosome segregation ATPase
MECEECFDKNIGNVTNRLDSIEYKVKHLENDVTHLEKEFKQHEERVIVYAAEAKASNKAIHARLDKQSDVNEQLIESMSTLNITVSKIADVVTKTREETAANSNYISEAEIRERQEKYAEEQVKKVLAPRAKLWNHVKMTAAGLITLATLTVLGKLAWLAINIDDLVNKVKIEEQMEIRNGK